MKYDLTGKGIPGYDDLNERGKEEVSRIVEYTQNLCDQQIVSPSVRVEIVTGNRDFTIRRMTEAGYIYQQASSS